jgi:outer membrane protein
MSHRLAIFTALILICSTARSDILGVSGGIGYWAVDFSGNAISGVSLNDDLNTQQDDGGYVFVAIEHPIPFLPNVKTKYTALSDSSASTLTQDFSFGGTGFTSNQVVNTTLDLTHVDFTFYYELLDLGSDLDLGVTGRYFRGELTIGGVREDINVLLPLAYARARFGLPFSGWYLGAEINASADIQDYELKFGWQAENFIFPEFGLELGYRKFSINADEDNIDVNLDVEADGVYIGLVGHF